MGSAKESITSGRPGWIRYFPCPCGEGKICDDKDKTPGFRSHDITIECEECRRRYRIEWDGTRWTAVEKSESQNPKKN